VFCLGNLVVLTRVIQAACHRVAASIVNCTDTKETTNFPIPLIARRTLATHTRALK